MKIKTKRKLTQLNEIKVTFNCAINDKKFFSFSSYLIDYLPRFF